MAVSPKPFLYEVCADRDGTLAGQRNLISITFYENLEKYCQGVLLSDKAIKKSI